MRVRSLEYKLRKAQHTREKRKRAIDEGICSSCFKERPIDSRKQCQNCIDINYQKYYLKKDDPFVRRKNALFQKKRRLTAKKNKICQKCFHNSATIGTICEKCSRKRSLQYKLAWKCRR